MSNIEIILASLVPGQSVQRLVFIPRIVLNRYETAACTYSVESSSLTICRVYDNGTMERIPSGQGRLASIYYKPALSKELAASSISTLVPASLSP